MRPDGSRTTGSFAHCLLRLDMLGRRFLLLGLILVLSGCGSSSFLGRRFDNFTAYYNTFYNARKAYERGVKSLSRNDTPVDRNRYLPIFSEPSRTAKSKDFEDAIKKSADVLRDHPRSKWVDDALLLIGKSYFYQQNYVGAEQKFREVIELGSDLEDEARFWLARTLIAGQAYDEAAAHLQESLVREGLEQAWAAMLHLALGELYVKRADWEAAAEALERGLAHVPERDTGARAQFLLGQVYETMGRYADAVAAFERVARFNPLYELGYAARYSAIRVEGRYGDGERALKLLRKMERDDKHYVYRADLAYLRGRILQAMGRTEEARAVYHGLLYNDDRSLDISRVRGRIHYALGEIHRDVYEDFVRAAAYFDSAAVALGSAGGTTASRGGTGLATERDPAAFAPEAILDAASLREQFGNYARVYREVSRMDSLLALGRMPPREFEAFILELRRQRARELEQQRRLREARQIEQRFREGAAGQTNNFQNSGLPDGKVVPGVNAPEERGEAGFLYHRDPVRLQEARSLFISRWGDRPRVPNWRRIDAISNQGVDPETEAVIVEGETLPGDEAAGTLPPIDVSAVPRDPLAQARMRAARAIARYELANVLFLGIDRPDSAAVWYRMVIEEDGDQPVAQRAYYALAEVQRALGDDRAARRLYEEVLAAYPNSDFADRVRERLGLAKASGGAVDSLGLAEEAYERAYQAWQRGAYARALNEMVRTAGAYAATGVAPRALLAAGAIYMEWAGRDSLDLFAPLPLSVSGWLLQQAGLVDPPSTDSLEAAARTVPSGAAVPEGGGGGNVPDSGNDRLALPAADPPADSLVQADVALVTGMDAAPARPFPVSLEQLYQTIGRRYGGTPYAEQARHLLAALEERRPAPDTTAAPAGFTDTLAVMPDSLAGPADTLAVAADTARVTPVQAEAGGDRGNETPPVPEKRRLLDERDRELLERKQRSLPGDSARGATGDGGTPAAGPPDAVYDRDGVETPPELRGGMEMLLRQLRYPPEVAREGITGEVVVRLVVDEQGMPVEPVVEAGLCPACDEEALRVVREARFRPGMLGGRPVKVRLTLTIPFKLR
ncbi:MAG: hypothetical protein KatS3mg043_0350 [Rhodothermaceae bacterium]|nr:MAG: hypothetical protein KatS3mg043_0350 [Rhodothermaceae bacterium]